MYTGGKGGGAHDNLLGRVTTQVCAGVLVIGTTGSFTTASPMSVEISVPSLQAVTLSGTGRILVHATGTLQASVSGSGAVVYSDNPAQVIRTITGTGAITKG